jgi:hypothetical protein
LRCSNEYWPSEVNWIVWDGKRHYFADDRTDELFRFREGAVLSVALVWRHRHSVEPIVGADPWQCIRPSEWLAIVGEPSPSAMIDAFCACPRGQHPVLCLQVLSHAASSEEGSTILEPCPRGGAPPTSCAVGPRKRQLSLVAAGTSSPCAALCLCHCSVARVAISCTILSVGVITHRGTISSPWWCAAELLRWRERRSGSQRSRSRKCTDRHKKPRRS